MDNNLAPLSLPVNFTSNLERERMLYFVRCGDFLKIGITHNIEKRLESFKIGNPKKVSLSAHRMIPAALALQIEKAVHKALKDYAHEGEWFKITTWTATKIADPIVRHGWVEFHRMIAEFEAKASAYRAELKQAEQLDRNMRMNGVQSNVVKLFGFGDPRLR